LTNIAPEQSNIIIHFYLQFTPFSVVAQVMFSPALYTLWERLMVVTGLQNNQVWVVVMLHSAHYSPRIRHKTSLYVFPYITTHYHTSHIATHRHTSPHTTHHHHTSPSPSHITHHTSPSHITYHTSHTYHHGESDPTPHHPPSLHTPLAIPISPHTPITTLHHTNTNPTPHQY
jgi:hypothetical protein